MKKQILRVGSFMTNEELYRTFKCGNIGGMRKSKAFNCLIITSNEEQDLYLDEHSGNSLKYIGMGRSGNQKLIPLAVPPDPGWTITQRIRR